ncbi:MAG: hypothetical protein ACK4RZ_15335 [Paracoccaceae bacterium]
MARFGSIASNAFSSEGGFTPNATYGAGSPKESSGTYRVSDGVLIRSDCTQENRDLIYRWDDNLMIGTEIIQPK